jgi:hypothetical protein
LKSLARRERARALAVNRKVEPPFDEIARLDAGMGVARDDSVPSVFAPAVARSE